MFSNEFKKWRDKAKKAPNLKTLNEAVLDWEVAEDDFTDRIDLLNSKTWDLKDQIEELRGNLFFC